MEYTVDSQYVTVEQLAVRRLPEEDFPLPDGSGMVRIRALSRAEVLRIQTLGGTDAAKLERLTLVTGVVVPVLTEASARAWQEAEAAGASIGQLSERIRELSGVTVGAAKRHYKSDGGQSGARAGSLSGAETRPDGGGTSGDDR